MTINRNIKSSLLEMASLFPVVSVTGPRQSGKTTLVQEVFANFEYLSFETPSTRNAFLDDPVTFLNRYNSHIIFDEAQRVPELFSYLQEIVDAKHEAGQFVVTGSQNFLLADAITQSLAGRVGVLTLLPLSYDELSHAQGVLKTDAANARNTSHSTSLSANRSANYNASDNSAGSQTATNKMLQAAQTRLEYWLFQGGYPRIYDANISPRKYFPSYIRTYLERDVRSELGVKKLHDFNLFVQLCALRTSNQLNVSALAKDANISFNTAKEWLSVLEASGIIYLLPPYFSNKNKSLTKTPKLYFLDSGLAANLIGLRSPDELQVDKFRGALFETAVVAEILKAGFERGENLQLAYWRNSHKQEIDLIVQHGARPAYAVEIKSSATYNSKFFETMNKIAKNELGLDTTKQFVVYGGDAELNTQYGKCVPYTRLHDAALQWID